MLIITRHLKLSVCQRDKFQFVEQLDKLEFVALYNTIFVQIMRGYFNGCMIE